MSRILFLLRQLVAGPVSVFSGPVSSVSDVYSGSSRGRSFIRALPALFVVVFGAVLLIASQFGREQRMVSKYDMLAQAAQVKSEQLIPDFQKAWSLYELDKMKKNETANVLDEAPEQAEKETDETAAGSDSTSVRNSSFFQLRDQLLALRSEEKLYLLKLMELQPENNDFRFRYAKTHSPFYPDVELELMSKLAPLQDQSGNTSTGSLGYAKAHLWMASHFLNRLNRSRDRSLWLLIEKHARSSLNLEPDNSIARQILANALSAREQFSMAFDEFRILFREDPRFFPNLLQLNGVINSGDPARREQQEQEILDDASRRLQQESVRTRNNEQEIRKWETAWELYATAMMRRKEFSRLRRELETERQMYDDEVKQLFLDDILMQAFTLRGDELYPRVATDSTAANEAISILEMAAESGKLNDSLKYLCTQLDRKVPELASRARKVYNYRDDPDPSGLVLSELALDDLAAREYSRAIENLERARVKMPQNPVVLNNLAFAYLKAENASPDRALKLVDSALQLSARLTISKEDMSRFYHTRGTALLQLNRMDEAFTAFNDAYKGRPNDEGILESLILCCEGRDERQLKTFQEALMKIRQQKSSGDAGAAGDPEATAPDKRP